MLPKRLTCNVNFKVLLTKFLLLTNDYKCVIILNVVSRLYKISKYSLLLKRGFNTNSYIYENLLIP